ncbi:hypothetical protein D3C76_1475710 [compost metagenome]
MGISHWRTGQYARPGRGGFPCNIKQVFDRHRYAGQRRQRVTRGTPPIGHQGLLLSPLSIHMSKGAPPLSLLVRNFQQCVSG